MSTCVPIFMWISQYLDPQYFEKHDEIGMYSGRQKNRPTEKNN
jgi:hypothetical protein